MRRSMAVLGWFVPVLVSLTGGSVVRAQTLTSDTERQSTWPANPSQAQVDDIWSKLVLLLSKHDGYVSLDNFQAVFGMKFGKGTPNGLGGIFYSTHQGKDWLLTTGLTIKPYGKKGAVSSSLGIDFKVSYLLGTARINPCLSTQKAFDNLIKSGWSGSFAPELNWVMLSRNGPYGEYVATVHYTRTCIFSVTVSNRSESPAGNGR